MQRRHQHLHPLRRATVKEFDKTEHEVSLDYVDKKVPYIQLICEHIYGKLTNIKYHGGGIEIYVYCLYIMELACCTAGSSDVV